MTATAERQQVEIRLRLPSDRYSLTLAGIIAVQVAWLGYLASRGWFYGDDLSYMSGASGQSLDWAYLSAPLNDHFVPGVRAAFWLMRHVTKLDYGATIAFRVALQLATTLLLHRLLVLLVGRRPGVLAIVAWYAVSPLIMPGFLWLTTSVHLVSSQLFVVLAIYLHVRYTITGRLRLALGCALSLLVAASFWEMTAITVAPLLLISLGFLHGGSLLDRVRATLRRWPGWLALAVVLGVWLGAFLSGPYGGSAHALRLGQALHVLRVAWLDSVGPAVIGGPWRWLSAPDVYFSVAYPRTGLVVAGQVAIVALLLLSLRRTGLRALLAWAIPAVCFVFDMLLVAVGRVWLFGDLTPRSFNYVYELAVPIAIGAALALLPSTPQAIRQRVTGQPEASRVTTVVPNNRVGAAVLLACVLLVVGSSVASAVTFSNRWSQNPSRKYVEALETSVRTAGADVNLWDTRVPPNVLAAFSSGNHVSDVLALAGRPARFDDAQSDPLIVKADGTIGPATFFAAAHGIQRRHTLCTQLVQHVGTWVVPFSARVAQNEYFLKISYLQQQPSVLYFTVRDAAGHETAPVGASRSELNQQLANVYLRLPLAAPRDLVIRSLVVSANICIGAVLLGVPLPAGGQ
jgi:hypothetical protein